MSTTEAQTQMTDSGAAVPGAAGALRLDPKNLADIGGNVLATTILQGEREKARRLYKDLKQGKQPSMGNFVVDGQLKLPLRLALDYSEFRGPFSFPAFQTAVQALLRNLAAQIRSDKPIQTFSSEEGEGAIVYGVPGVIASQDGQHNVLMMTFEFSSDPVRSGLRLKLMFVDPEQFQQAAPDSDVGIAQPETGTAQPD